LENLKGKFHQEELGMDGNNIRINFRETVWEVADWMRLT
jgi:hypothetical protein